MTAMTFTDATIERYLAGELSADAAAKLESAVAADAELKARVDALKAERDAFLAADPAAAFAHRLMTRLEVAKEQSVKVPWWRSAVIPVFATTAAVLLGVTALLTLNREMSPDAANVAAKVAAQQDVTTQQDLTTQQVPAAIPPPIAAKAEPEAAGDRAGAALSTEQPKGLVAKADAPRERSLADKTNPKKAKVEESVMDPNEQRVANALSRKDADDAARGSGSGIGIGSGSVDRRAYAKAPPQIAETMAQEEAPRDEDGTKPAVHADAKSKERAPAKSAPRAEPTAGAAPSAPAAAEKKSSAAKAEGGVSASLDINGETSLASGSNAVDAAPSVFVQSPNGPTRIQMVGQSIKVVRGRAVRVAADWPAAHVAVISIDKNGKLVAHYQGSGRALHATFVVNTACSVVILRSAQSISLEALSAQAAKLHEQAMSLTFIPSGIERRFVRFLVEE